MTSDEWIEAIADVATDWQDPDYGPRADAVQAALEADNRYTEEGLAFALNHRMHQLTSGALQDWIGARLSSSALNVGVVCSDAPPLDGLTEVVAALVLDHHVWVATSPASPSLICAFFAEVADITGEQVRFESREALLERVDVLVASGTAGAMDVLATEAEEAGISSEHRWLHRHQPAVAVIDGGEDAETRSGLAEDLLLHEGESPRSPSILWAPEGHEPDNLLDTLAGFRELYPAHPSTDGSLSLPAAFLASAGQAHAIGPGFLVSKGAPESQPGAHIRWSEYESLDEVVAWCAAHRVGLIVARETVVGHLGINVPTVEPGEAHRPKLGAETPGLLDLLTESSTA